MHCNWVCWSSAPEPRISYCLLCHYNLFICFTFSRHIVKMGLNISANNKQATLAWFISIVDIIYMSVCMQTWRKIRSVRNVNQLKCGTTTSVSVYSMRNVNSKLFLATQLHTVQHQRSTNKLKIRRDNEYLNVNKT